MNAKELTAQISKLPSNYQLALSLRYVHSMDDDEIAECMMVNKEIVERHFRDALNRLNMLHDLARIDGRLPQCISLARVVGIEPTCTGFKAQPDFHVIPQLFLAP